MKINQYLKQQRTP